MTPVRPNRNSIAALFFVVLICVSTFVAVPAFALPYQVGDVFVAVSSGKVQHRDATGRLLETLDSMQPSFTSGMAFDSRGNLYVTNFGSGTVSRFNSSGALLGTFGRGYSGSPESIVFDRNGNAYVGSVNGDNRLRKFDPVGNPLGSFGLAIENRGSDWIDLSPDLCTIFYTSEGSHVKRFNVCTNAQLSDFNVSPLPGPVAYALRILPDGGLLVADSNQIVRLSAAGSVIRTYQSTGENCFFALNLDPDGKSFWSADFCSANVHKFDIQTGTEVLPHFNTGTGNLSVFGIVVFGELSASHPTSVAASFGSAGTTTNRSGNFSDPVNTGTGNYYFSHTDLAIPGRGIPLMFSRAYNSLDSYSGPMGAGWTHSYNVLLRPSAGRIVTVKEPDGHEVLFAPTGSSGYTPATPGVFDTLTKNADGSFTLTRKNQTQLNFAPTGELLAIMDRNGNTQALAYDGNGNLVQITDAVGRKTLLAYDANNRLTKLTDPVGRSTRYAYDASGNLSQTTDPAGGITAFAYDTNHRLTSVVLPNGNLLLQNTYDAIGRVISQTNGRGFASTFAYGTPTPSDTTITDGRGNQTIHSTDANFRLVTATDPLGGVVTYAYDAQNNRTGVMNQNGKTTTFAYDAHGNATGITDPLGDTATFTYDANNNLLSAKNPKGNSTTFSYDAQGNLIKIVDAAGSTTNFGYDPHGELTSKQDALDNATRFAYGAFGDLVRVTDPLGNSTSLGYDGISRLLIVSDPNGHTAKAAYDALSRLVKVTDPLGHATQFAYDTAGNLIKITDANGNSTSYGYDAVNNLAGVTDALGHVTNYGYDQNNNRVSFKNAKGAVTGYSFDALNRLVQITDPLLFLNEYTYDATGNVLSKKDANGNLNHFVYDALNRLAGISYADGKNVAYAYDTDGKRTTMTDWHGTTSYSYDLLDRLTSVANPSGKVVQYAYDALGHRKSLTYPDGKRVNYSYDPANRLAQVQDWLGRVTRYSYDTAGNLRTIGYPNRTSIELTYDAASRLIQVHNLLAHDDDNWFTPTANFTYQLDAVGNRLSVTNGRGFVKKYTYDPLYELTSATKSIDDPDCDGPDDAEVKYAYDAVGNRVSLAQGRLTVPYTYDIDDRLLKAGTATFTYDANGNQTSASKTLTGLQSVYRYDAANRLIFASGFLNSTFDYDGDGDRVLRSVGPSTFNYVNDVAATLPAVLQESGPRGNISYDHGLNLISESSSSFDYFYQFDALGSVVGLTDSIGRLTTRYDYDPWGVSNARLSNSIAGNEFRFASEQADFESGLYYLRARYYDPSIGRFLTRDPLYRPSANPYAYAGNSPTIKTDPTGLLAMELGIGANLAAVIGGGGEATLVEDDQGNHGIAFSGGVSLGAQAGASVNGVISLTKGTISDLNGVGLSLSADVHVIDGVSVTGLFDTQLHFTGVEVDAGVGGKLALAAGVSYGHVVDVSPTTFSTLEFLLGPAAAPLIGFDQAVSSGTLSSIYDLLNKAQTEFGPGATGGTTGNPK